MRGVVVAILFLWTGVLGAQGLKIPMASPTQVIKQNFALSELVVDYSRPGVKGRTIFGELVPYGRIWRTGANATTKITFGEDVTVEGKPVAAGTYGLYSIPNKDSWELMLYKDITLAGNVASYKLEEELIRFTVKPTTISPKIELFTIGFADVTANSCVIELSWDKTRVAFSVSSEIDTKIMQNIELAMNPEDTRPYFQAASYYFENDKDLEKALDWVNKAIDQNNKAFWIFMLKAKIQYKMNDFSGTVVTANRVVELAKEAKNDDYVKVAEKLIAESKKAR